MWELQEFSFIAGRMQNGTATLADSLALSYKAKHTITMHNSTTGLFGILSKGLKIYPHKKLHTDVYRSLIHNSKTWEAAKILFSTRMDK